MDDRRRLFLSKLKKENITSNGRYIDVNKPEMFDLTVDDILFLRAYHKDPRIAYNVIIQREVSKVQRNSQTVHRDATKPKSQPASKNVKVSRDPRYNDGKHRTKNPIVVLGKRVLIFGVIVCIGVGSMTLFLDYDKDKEDPVKGAYVTMTEGWEYESGNSYMDSPTVPSEEEDDLDYIRQVERAEFIRILCDIFQVDYQTTYTKLVEMTDNFTDDEYLAGRHPLVSCKGMSIDADSEEEFLVYAVRVIAQDPGRVDLTQAEVCVNNGYESGTDYNAMIAKWAGVLDVDPALVYGIMKAETGFSSELFIEGNNPGGLKDGSGFWIFDNKEAGIIELMMEIIKYQYNGANTIEEMARIHCPINDPDDTQGLNRNWVRNVTSGYEEGREIFERMGFYKNNGLSY